MKASELRIGNLVIYEGMISVLTEITCTDVVLDHPAYESEIQASVFDIKPIPLTEDWLIKFGFTKIDRDDEDFTYFKKGNIEFTDVSPNGIELVWYELSPCISIHQLQNLYFALTGEELSIKD